MAPAPWHARASFVLAAALSVAFVVMVYPVLGTVFWDYDEGYYIVDARHILAGRRPYVDFPYHQPPLYLYLLALSGKLFGQTVFGFRVLSLASMAASGFLLFCLTKPFVGSLPALATGAFFLFSQSQIYALSAVPEPTTVFFTLLGAVLLFLGSGRASAYASALAFVVALLLKPTCLLMVLAAALSLAYARAWTRLAHLAIAGAVAAAFAAMWMLWVSEGIFADVLRLQVERMSTRSFGMWSVDTGFVELRRQLGIETPRQWALYCFRNFYIFPEVYVPMAVFLSSFLGLPLWVARCARSSPAVRAFSVLWPISYLLTNFVLLDFVSDKYFVPFLAFSSFLLAALVWLLQRQAGSLLAGAVGIAACAVLGTQFAQVLGRQHEPWYERADQIGRDHRAFVSFTPMLFAVTGAEPGCGMDNPALTYGGFGEKFLVADRTRQFRYSDERLLECLKANRSLPVVVDWSFYYFTRPGAPLRAYLGGEGSDRRIFSSPEALAQWGRADLTMPPG